MFAIKDEDLEPLIARELASSKVQHEERFESKEQAADVLYNEIEEAGDELMKLDEYFIAGLNDDIEKHAMDGIKELIQVVAMCRKWKESKV